MKTGSLALLAVVASTTAMHLKESEIAKFDNLNAGLVPGIPVRGITPLGPYQDLFYSNMGVIALNTVVASIDAQSGSNGVAYDLIAQQQGPQNITSKYLDSKTLSFDLKSFYLGCLAQKTATSVPGACDIALTGYRNGKQTAMKTVSFEPSGAESKMQFIDLGKKFWDVDTSAFMTEGLLQRTLLGVLFDDVVYDVVLKK